MGHSQAEKAQSRERIVGAAARQVREGGLESVSIADLMKQAKLTHGGFYGHFPSRSALLAAALERALFEGEAASIAANKRKGPRTLKSITGNYLSAAHRDDIGEGCAVAALLGDVSREEPEVREIMTQRLELYFSDLARVIGDVPKADELAVSTWCTMVGALMLSRLFKGEERSDAILRIARKAILDSEAHAKEQV
ncbi:MAG TPA: TetR/AcrR family transcriptional regulator [Rhizomicrobium sp.]|jgi:TetR/AcrR family transcriptional repressor of nem operon|nr:TetR/AcrR family transcriptional regulator [Rhizomicrobium sp.]